MSPNITVAYTNASGDKMVSMSNIDFCIFDGMHQLGEEALHKMADAIEKIKDDIGHMTTGFRKLNVVAYTKEEEAQRWAHYGAVQERR